MFKVVGWNLVPKVCKICGELKDKTDMVVDSWDQPNYCHDCYDYTKWTN